jgi:hypothetical protein
MAKISKRDVYIPKIILSLRDYFLMTDFEDNLKTKTTEFTNVLTALNAANGITTLNYRFSSVQNETINFDSPGYFFSSSNIVEPELVTKLFFNRFNIHNINCIPLFQFLVSENVFLLKFVNSQDPNNVIFLKPSNITVSATYLEFNVEDYQEVYQGNFIDDCIYALDFVFEPLAGTGGGTTVHNELTGREDEDCHPITSITGLFEALQEINTQTLQQVLDEGRVAEFHNPDAGVIVQFASEDIEGYVNLEQFYYNEWASNSFFESGRFFKSKIISHFVAFLDYTTQEQREIRNILETPKPEGEFNDVIIVTNTDNDTQSATYIVAVPTPEKSATAPIIRIRFPQIATSGDYDVATTNQVGNLIREEFTFTSSQTFTLANNYGQVYSVEVQGQGALSTSQYTLVSPNQITINDTLDSGDYVVVIYSNAITGLQPYYSQSEVDALLNLKANSNQTPQTWYSALDGTSVANTLTITPTYTQLIPAGTFTEGDVVEVAFRSTSPVAKTSSSSNYVYINTSNNLIGTPIQVAIFTSLATNRTIQIQRSLSIKSTITKVINPTTSLSTDTGLNAAMSNLTIDWTIDQYFIFAIGHTVADQTLFGDFFRIIKN